MSEEKKQPVTVRPGESASPIRPGGSTLASMLGSFVAPKTGAGSHIRSIEAVHDHYFQAGGIRTGASADMALTAARATAPPPAKAPSAGLTLFCVGETVYDTERNRSAVITKLNIGKSQKGRPIHRLVAQDGAAWRQIESRLRRK